MFCFPGIEGALARGKGKMLNRERHCVLEAAHPSPLSSRLFAGNRREIRSAFLFMVTNTSPSFATSTTRTWAPFCIFSCTPPLKVAITSTWPTSIWFGVAGSPLNGSYNHPPLLSSERVDANLYTRSGWHRSLLGLSIFGLYLQWVVLQSPQSLLCLPLGSTEASDWICIRFSLCLYGLAALRSLNNDPVFYTQLNFIFRLQQIHFYCRAANNSFSFDTLVCEVANLNIVKWR